MHQCWFVPLLSPPHDHRPAFVYEIWVQLFMMNAVYLIFGASGGIGSALAARLGREQDASLVLGGGKR